jgi:hypothetical protein
MADLHLTFICTDPLRQRLQHWDEAILREGQLAPGDWGHFAVWSAASSATTSASTGIEGNPLSPEQVDAVLAGQAVRAAADHVREVVNYNRAMRLAHRAAGRSDFAWTHGIIQEVNAAVLEGLPDDAEGRYRTEDVPVGIFQPPSGLIVQGYMDALIDWLRRDRSHALIRSALLHLNVIAIHPFANGNGRTARILSAIELVRGGISAPELVGIEPYLRRNRDEYIEMLRLVLGHSYHPDEHPATEWLDYYTRISLDRLEFRNRVRDVIPTDAGNVILALAARGDPLEWARILLAAAVRPITTREVAEWTSRSPQAVRATLGQMVASGWLDGTGHTRARRFVAGARLRVLPLRLPDLVDRMAAGAAPDEQLSLWPIPQPSGAAES